MNHTWEAAKVFRDAVAPPVLHHHRHHLILITESTGVPHAAAVIQAMFELPGNATTSSVTALWFLYSQINLANVRSRRRRRGDCGYREK